MTGPTGAPPTSPATKQDTTKSVQGSTGSTTGATTDISQPAAVKATGTDQSAAEKILETNPSATASTAPKLTSGSQIETATTPREATVSSQMGMGGVVEPSLPQGSGESGSGQSKSSNTIIVGSDTSSEQQDRRGQSEGLADTASQYSRDVGRRTSEVYEQGRQAAGQAWDTAQRAADQVRRQGSQGLSSVQPMLRENPVAGIMVGAAVGVLVGYLLGHATASARTTRTRRHSDRDELSNSGSYPGSYGGSYSSSSHYPDGERNTDILRYADRVRYSDGN
jgi:ElaB/YqjD/DUF883 family membrane-anchored ribosome-binding protein